MVTVTKFAESLKHWSKCFRDGTLHDECSEEIACLLEDHAYEIIKNIKEKNND